VSPAAPAGERVQPARPLTQQAAPLLQAVRQAVYASRIRAHGPGHTGGRAAAADVRAVLGSDLFAADVWLETAHFDRVRRDAEALAAEAWGAERAWLLDGGSSSGNLAWCLASLREGEEVIVARDAHVSILNGLMLSGARPRWVAPRMHHALGIPLGIEAADLEQALRQYPNARQVIVSSPGSAGPCTDVAGCVRVAAAHGARLYCDQAWGAHLAFHEALPDDAIAAGAAGAVVSVHKSGPALSSGALLLAGDGADLARLEHVVRATQTTSPLLPLLASVDAARRDLATSGRERLDGVLAAADWLAAQLRLVPGLYVAGTEDLGLPARRVDPTKLAVDVSGFGYTGWEVAAVLRDGGTVPEGADARRVYLVLGCDPATALSTASAVLAELLDVSHLLATSAPHDDQQLNGLYAPENSALSSAWDLITSPADQVLTPRQAHQANAVPIPSQTAVGRVAAEPVTPYPPGVPVILPGERITAAALEVLATVVTAGGHLHGCADPTAETLRVIEAS